MKVPMPSNCHPAVSVLPSGRSQPSAVGVKILEEAKRERIPDVEIRRPLVGARVERVLRSRLSYGAGKSRDEAADHGAGVIDRLGKRVARLKSESECGQVSLRGYLQGVIGGV